MIIQAKARFKRAFAIIMLVTNGNYLTSVFFYSKINAVFY